MLVDEVDDDTVLLDEDSADLDDWLCEDIVFCDELLAIDPVLLWVDDEAL